MLGLDGIAPERAATVDVGVEQTIRAKWRVTVSAFNREERAFIRRPGGETRIVNARLVRGSQTAPYASRLSGTAQPTVTVLCTVAVSPSAYVTVSFAV